MGCLCPRLFNQNNNKEIKEKLNDEEKAPVPNPFPNEADLERNCMTIGFSKYKDLPQKRNFAEYLVSNDYNTIKKYIDQMINLEDEEFFQLFVGNTECNYSVPNEDKINQDLDN